MPARSDLNAQSALLTGVNVRGGSGAKLLDDTSTDLDLPTFDTSAGEGIYPDLLVFLNGGVAQPVGTHGSAVARDLAADLTDAWQTAGELGDFTIGIDANDRVYVENDTTDFQVLAASDPVFGFTADTGLAGGSAPFRHTADSAWTRGVLEYPVLKVDDGGVTNAQAPSQPWAAQDMPTLLRAYAIGDADDLGGAQTLTYLHNTAHDPDHRRITWVIDATGHVRVYWPTSLSLSLDFSGNAYAAFLDLIGYTGNESTATAASGDLTCLRFEHPAAGCLFPGNTIQYTDFTQDRSEATGLRGGGVASAQVDLWHGKVITVLVDGPASAGHTITRTIEDLDYHFRRRFLPYARKGARLTLIRDFGDNRLHQDDMQATASRAAYSTLYNSTWRQGKWRMQVSDANVDEQRVNYQGGIASFYEVTITAKDWVY